MAEPRPRRPCSRIRDLHVYYGESHAIQGVDLTLDRRILAIVGRNGMGKTTLCNTIVGLKRRRGGSINFAGREIARPRTAQIARLGVGYVPQGRRVWRSLTVDEHLRLAARGGATAAWTVERIYQTFPRLAERRSNGGAQLSGGEQQMLAIAARCSAIRASWSWTSRPRASRRSSSSRSSRCLITLAEEGEMSVLLIEQNIGVATTVAENVAIMVNGRIHRVMPRASSPATATCSSACSASGATTIGGARTPAEPRRDRGAGRRSLPGRARRQRRGGGRAGRRRVISACSRRLPNRWSLGDAELGRSAQAFARRHAATATAEDGCRPRHVRHARSPSATAAPRWSSAPSTPRAAN